MLFGTMFDRFIEKSPVSVMVRGLMERAFGHDDLNPLFTATAETQYIASMIAGTVSVIPVPDALGLAEATARVVRNNGFDETRSRLVQGARNASPHASPR